MRLPAVTYTECAYQLMHNNLSNPQVAVGTRDRPDSPMRPREPTYFERLKTSFWELVTDAKPPNIPYT